MYLACRSADPNDEGKIMASDATERKWREKTVSGAATMEKLRRKKERRYGEREERGDVMLRRLSEMGI